MISPGDRPSAERWQQIQQLFDNLVELAPEERARRLEEDGPLDRELRRTVESLLAAHDQADDVLHGLEHPELLGAVSRAPGGRGWPDPFRLIGRTIAQYRVIEVLGGGGMGLVYRADDLRLHRNVALKFLPPVHDRDPLAKERFVREAQTASALDHPNICTVHEIGEAEDGSLFIAMACYGGESLREWLKRGPLAFSDGLRLAIEIARGLAAVHRQGIVHRDIKPANLMVTEDGTIRILDFGLAKFTDVTLTQTGRTMGTAAYMSPEQARAREVDARADLWSLGVVLYEMITGQRPFCGDHEQSVVYAILNEEPEPPRSLRAETPRLLETVVLKLLRKDPQARYPDADTLLGDLEAIRDSREPPTLAREPPAKRARAWPRRAAQVAGVLLLVAGGIRGAMKLRPTASALDGAVRVTTIAVLPFSVEGSRDLDYLRDGMVDLLSLKLDASGKVRSLTPRVIQTHLRHSYPGGLERDPTHASGGGWAAETARHFLATYYIVGSVAQDSAGVHLSASVHTPEWEEPLGVTESTTTGQAGLMDAVDELADALISQLPGAEVRRVPSIASLTSASLPALRAYLEGRQTERLDTHHSNEWMRRAIAADSVFALAWFYLAFNREFFRGGEEIERALQLRDRLPERQRVHLDGYKALVDGRAPDAERLYRRILAIHNDDVDAWRMLGKTLTRYNGFYGRPVGEARDAFERALALDPDELQARYWLLEVAAVEGKIDEFDSIATLSAQGFAAGSPEWHLYRILPRLTGASPSERAAILADLNGSDRESVSNGLSHYAERLGDLPTLLWLDQSATEPSRPPTVQSRGHLQLAFLEAARGRFEVAERHLQALDRLNPAWGRVLRPYLAALFHAPVQAADLRALRRQVAAWDTTTPLVNDTHIGGWADLGLYLQGLLSFRLEDEAATRAFATQLERRAAAQDRGIPAGQMGATLEALGAWKAGELPQALAALDRARVDLPMALRDSPLHSHSLNRYVRGEVLYGEGKYRDALRWFESLNTGVEDDFMWLYLAPAQLRIAEIHERLGEAKEAANHYRRFLALWHDCDPALRPMVETAAQRLETLGTAAAATVN